MAKSNKKYNFRLVYRIITIFIAILIGGIGALFIDNIEEQNIKPTTAKEYENIELVGDNLLQIHFFDVGQADSTLIISDNQTMLIDAGKNDTGKTLVKKIKNLGITSIDYLVGTHPHEDHIGGLDNIINSFDIGTVFMPNITTDYKTYKDVIKSVNKKGLKIINPKKDDTFKVGDINCQIMLCDENLANEQNNLNLASIVIRAEYKDKSYIFMADSEKENEISRQWPKTNVLKVGHHGSNSSSSAQFLKQISPEIAIIQCGKDNEYGYPKQVVLDKLTKLGTMIYRTDLNGNILLESDGINNKISFY